MKRHNLSLIHMLSVLQLQSTDMTKTSSAALQHWPMLSSGSAEGTWASQTEPSVHLKSGECRVTIFKCFLKRI